MCYTNTASAGMMELVDMRDLGSVTSVKDKKGMESFFERVYAVARQIPKGKVATYGQLAMLAGSPRASRVVGSAMATCHDSSVPCHRVVDRFGGTKIAFDDYAPGTQRAMLEEEGVEFRLDGTVDLERFQWRP